MDEQRLKALRDEMTREYPEFISFFAKHGRSIVVGAILVLAMAAAVNFYKSNRRSSVDTAAVMLANSKSVEDLEKLTAEYRGTPSAPLAYMSLAKAYFNAGDYDMALNKYLEFQKSFPKHELNVSVELNRIACLEARGQAQDALAAYEEFIKANPDHFLKAEALFGKARCFEAAGDLVRARSVYEDYLVENPRGLWFSRAEEALDAVEKKIKAQSGSNAAE